MTHMSIFTAFMAICKRKNLGHLPQYFTDYPIPMTKILPVTMVLVLLDCRDGPVNSLYLRVELLSNKTKVTIQSLQMPWPAER